MFGHRFARHLAARYGRRGLDRTWAAFMVSILAERGLDGASVLEVGGGFGDIKIELLRRRVSRTTNVEFVDAYDAEAVLLAGVAAKGDRRLHLDRAADRDAVESLDIVVSSDAIRLIRASIHSQGEGSCGPPHRHVNYGPVNWSAFSGQGRGLPVPRHVAYTALGVGDGADRARRNSCLRDDR